MSKEAENDTNDKNKKAAEDAAAKKAEDAAAGDAGDDEKDASAGKTFTQAELDRALAKQKKELEKAKADAEAAAKLSEDERAKAEISALQKQIAERDARDAVLAEATKLGVANPALVYKLVSGELDFDDAGKLSNLTDVIESAKADFPDAFKKAAAGSVDAGAGANGEKTYTREQIKSMSADQINENWEAVSTALAGK